MPPGTNSYAMFSIMDFLLTLAGIIGGKLPVDRPIDGVDQSDVLFAWTIESALPVLVEYERSVEKHPNSPAPNLTYFVQTG